MSNTSNFRNNYIRIQKKYCDFWPSLSHCVCADDFLKHILSNSPSTTVGGAMSQPKYVSERAAVFSATADRK